MNLQEQRPSQYELYGFQLSEAESTDVLGTIYKAVELSSKADVAVRVFSPLVDKDPVLIEALSSYVAEISKVNHTNIQRVISFENGDQGCVLVKEYIDGMRFDEYLKLKGALDWQHALRFIRQLLLGLTCAQEAGFVHRGMAPDSIFVTRGNTAKITDIGLTRLIKEYGYLSEEEWNQSTTRQYAASETLNGEFRTANEASDVYSIGLIAYEMLTGISPALAAEPDYFVQENLSSRPVNTTLLLNKGVPEELALILQKATEQHAIHRFPNAAAMLEAIDEMETVSIKPSVVYHERKRLSRPLYSSFPKALIFAGTILALLSAGFFFLQKNKKNPFEALNIEQISPLRDANATSPVTLGQHLQLNSPLIADSIAKVKPGDEAFREKDVLNDKEAMDEEVMDEEVMDEEAINREANREKDIPSQTVVSREPRVESTSRTRFHTLIVRSNPSGASTLINGKEMGITPFRLSNVTSKKMEIVLLLEGHKEVSEEIVMEDGNTTEAFFNLIPVNRRLIITVFPWGNIYLDGELIAERVSGTDTLLISQKASTLLVVHPSLGSWEKPLGQETGLSLTYSVDFRER